MPFSDRGLGFLNDISSLTNIPTIHTINQMTKARGGQAYLVMTVRIATDTQNKPGLQFLGTFCSDSQSLETSPQAKV